MLLLSYLALFSAHQSWIATVLNRIMAHPLHQQAPIQLDLVDFQGLTVQALSLISMELPTKTPVLVTTLAQQVLNRVLVLAMELL